MKEARSESFNLSSLKISSMNISLDKKRISKNSLIKGRARQLERNSKKSISKENNIKSGKKKSNLFIINSQLQKHNSTPLKKSIMIINDVIDTKTNHYLAIFKDYLISDYIDEFLKRYFLKSESLELLPKFYIYYQNYLKFFCRGCFTDFTANSIIQEYGECQAELYYNNNYGRKNKKEKANRNEENINNQDSSQDSSNTDNISNINKIKKIFTETIKNSIDKIENDKLMQYYIYKYNTNEISNIYYKNKNETITLNDDSKITSNDNLLTNENSLINLIDMMIQKRREKKKTNENNKNNNNNNVIDNNIINIYKNLLNQSPIKSARNININCDTKNSISKKTSKNVSSSLKIINKNNPTTTTIKTKRNNSNISNEYTKSPAIFENQKLSKKKVVSRNIKNKNINNLFMKSSLTQRGNYKHISKSISSRLGGGGDVYSNFPTTKNTSRGKKLSSLNTNLNIINQNSKKIIKFNGLCFRNNDSNNLLHNSNMSSKNLKKNAIYCFPSNKNIGTGNGNIISLGNNNNKKINKRIKHYQYINYKNQKYRNKKSKQNNSLSNPNSIFNDFHININNNIMFLNNGNNNTHYHSNKNNIKTNSKNSKNKQKINDIKVIMSKQKKSRNITVGMDLKKYKTEIKNLQSNKNNRNMFRKYVYLVKPKSKDKTNSGNKEKEKLMRNKSKSKIFNSNSCFRIKKYEDSDIKPSLKDIKKMNNSNKNLHINKPQKFKVIFDYKKK